MTFLGKGPHETYLDRQASGMIGLYSGQVGDFTFDYIRPQENGNHVETRWLALQDETGKGIIIQGLQNLSTSVWPCSQGAMIAAKHPVDLFPLPGTLTVNVDLAQMGIGGETGCGSLPPDQYVIPEGTHSYGFWIRKYEPKMGDLKRVARQDVVLP
jgi:beta-galactosidase